MRFNWQPQPNVVDSGSWWISRRGRLAGSDWHAHLSNSTLTWRQDLGLGLNPHQRAQGVQCGCLRAKRASN
jgi:hypothetical protein